MYVASFNLVYYLLLFIGLQSATQVNNKNQVILKLEIQHKIKLSMKDMVTKQMKATKGDNLIDFLFIQGITFLSGNQKRNSLTYVYSKVDSIGLLLNKICWEFWFIKDNSQAS